jgi:hypothetical protein
VRGDEQIMPPFGEGAGGSNEKESPPAADFSDRKGNRPGSAVIRIAATSAIQRQDAGTGGTAAALPTDAPLLKPRNEAEAIDSAIRLFSASSASNSRIGARVRSILQELHGEAEIGFAELGSSANARALEGLRSWGQYDIQVNERYRHNVAMISLRLVHEAIHHIVDRSYIDEELMARSFQIDYYNELLTGVTVDRARFQVPRGTDNDIEAQGAKRELGQLVDYILSIEAYQGEGFFTAEWVVRHKNDWGGLTNRWPYTKARFVKEFLEDPVRYAAIFMETLESAATDRSSFTDVINWVGGIGRVRHGLRFLLYSAEYFTRIRDIQERTGFYLGAGERPGRRQRD